MSITAWQKRQLERQRLLRSLYEGVIAKQDEVTSDLEIESETFIFELTRKILDYLGGQHKHVDPAQFQVVETNDFRFNAGIHWDIMRGSLINFSRSEEEMNDLIATLLREDLIPSLANHFLMEALKQEKADPQKIFHAKSCGEYV